jgi:hypothetical protein
VNAKLEQAIQRAMIVLDDVCNAKMEQFEPALALEAQEARAALLEAFDEQRAQERQGGSAHG